MIYNFLSQYRIYFRNTVWGIAIIITGLIFIFASEIFKESNVFFYTSSTIAQGFIALVAFLGTVVVFKVQLDDQSMQKLSDIIEASVASYPGPGNMAKTYTPTQMMNACKEIISNKEDFGDKDFIKKIKNKMEKTLASRGEIRSRMVDFTIISFLNVSVALIGLIFTPIFVEYWYAGGLLLTANVYLSIFSLTKAFNVVRSAMGYDFLITL